METTTPVPEIVERSSENLEKTPETILISASPAVKSNLREDDVKETPTKVVSRPPESSISPAQDVINIPSYSRWFSWDKIHECEQRSLPEFFDGRSFSKNPKVYKYFRDSIIRIFRTNPSRKITFTHVRKVLVGDVGSIRRVFDFLEGWGLINYAGNALKPQQKGDEKENKTGGESGGSPYESSQRKKESSKKLCSGCKSVCSIACFVCDKFDLTLCARCYVRGNYRVGVTCSDFRRVEISEETKTSWTDKETLHLLEAIMHYGDDWKKVAEHVGGRSEKECVARFIKLPFGEQFIGPVDSEDGHKYNQMKYQSDAGTGADNLLSQPSEKRKSISPLADASNPIMAQAAFLSAVVGSRVAEAAAQAAVTALYEDFTDDQRKTKHYKFCSAETEQKESVTAANGDTAMSTMEEAVERAQKKHEKEEQDLERSISGIIEVQMKEIQDKIVHFEEVELEIEKERHQLQHMKNLLFADQLALPFQRTSQSMIGEIREDVRSTDSIA